MPKSSPRRALPILPTLLAACFALALASATLAAAPIKSFVSETPTQESFPLVAEGRAAPLYYSPEEHSGVKKVAAHLQDDIAKVTGLTPELRADPAPRAKTAVLIGTLGQSPLIDRLAAEGKLKADAIAGRWETFGLQTVANPLPGIDRALVVFGSDKRGTIFGIYELSGQIGVSPWHWWADVPAQTKQALHVAPGLHTLGEPKVKYRGIFINDEAPALTNWAEETFGGFNHEFYEKVYELILRHKANYLWPAMWIPAAFYEDDPENARLADELGVVIATTHHEPMMRAHDEWNRFGEGPWDYEANGETLREFWRGGIERMGDYESVVTIGMRGDGDHAMTDDTRTDLMERIIADQRQIIEEVTDKPASATPQVWALYKEMQDYWDKGMRVPDDVLILLCDDNWGNIRVLPSEEDRQRSGGFGIYYHFDFVGGPVSYRWLNVTQIERVWEQMKLSYDWGARELWLVNVGDIKPMELPTSFFLDFAWNPEAIQAGDLPQYYLDWTRQQFGPNFAPEIADLLSLHTKYNARRTPEMLAPDTYSLANYREAERVIADYRALVERAKAFYQELPAQSRSAFYQLVLFPIEASCNLNEMYFAAGKNNAYATQGRAIANAYAEQTLARFQKDAELTRYFHEELEDGKWKHMMSQTKIGYTHWNNPPLDKMPAVNYVQPTPEPGLGYALEFGPGPQAHTQGGARYSRSLPAFDPVNDQEYYIELFNTGSDSLDYQLEASENWIQLSESSGTLAAQKRIFVSIDWTQAPASATEGSLRLSGPKASHQISVPIRPDLPQTAGFVENNGVVSIEAANYHAARDSETARWTVVPNLGRTGSSLIIEPSDAEAQTPAEGAPRLDYAFTVFEEGEVTVEVYLSPTLNYNKGDGLRYAVAIDDEEPQVVNMHEGETAPDWEYPLWWNTSVTDHIKVKRSRHRLDAPGPHTLKLWAVDPGVVFQKFVIDAGGLQPSYLGPPQSRHLP